jgi:hypothetical protein
MQRKARPPLRGTAQRRAVGATADGSARHRRELADPPQGTTPRPAQIAYSFCAAGSSRGEGSAPPLAARSAPFCIADQRHGCRIVYVSRPHGILSPRGPPRAGGAAGAAGAAGGDERVEGRRRHDATACHVLLPAAAPLVPPVATVHRVATQSCHVPQPVATCGESATCCDPVVPRAAFPNALQRLPGVESAAGVDDGVHAGQPPAGYSRSLPLPPSRRRTIRRPPLCRFFPRTPVALVARCVSRVARCACRCNRPTRRGVPVGRPVRPRLQAQAVCLLSPAERARHKRYSCLARPNALGPSGMPA